MQYEVEGLGKSRVLVVTVRNPWLVVSTPAAGLSGLVGPSRMDASKIVPAAGCWWGGGLGGHVVPPSGPNGKKREGGQDVHASVARNSPCRILTVLRRAVRY